MSYYALFTNFKFIKMKNLIFTLAVLIFMISCSEDNENNSISESYKIENRSLEEKIAYTQKHLIDIAEVINKSLKNNKISMFVTNENNKKGVGEDKFILVKDIIVFSKKTKSLSDEDILKLQNSIDAFKGIIGNNLQPQIYFPKNINMETLRGLSDEIIYVPFVIENIEDEYAGFVENESGELEELGYLIGEEIANTENVVVISLNEEDFTHLPTTYEPVSSNTNIQKYSAYIDWFKIKQHKESWAAGASEINIKAMFEYHNGYHPSIGSAAVSCDRTSIGHTSDFRITQVSRNQVNNQTTIYANYLLQSNWWESPDFIYGDSKPPRYYFVIYEYDGWPATWQSPEYETFPAIFGFPSRIGYMQSVRSEQSSYITDRVESNEYQNILKYVGTYSANNDGIQFKTKIVAN